MTKCGPWHSWPSHWSERVYALDQTLGTRLLLWHGGFAGCFHLNLWSHSSRNECRNCVVVQTQWYEQTPCPCSLVASIRGSSSIGFVSTILASSVLDVRDAMKSYGYITSLYARWYLMMVLPLLYFSLAKLSPRLLLSTDPSQILAPGIIRPPNLHMLRLHSRVIYLMAPCIPPHQSLLRWNVKTEFLLWSRKLAGSSAVSKIHHLIGALKPTRKRMNLHIAELYARWCQ